MGFFANFHSKGVFEKNLNATFISLIPKVVGAVDLKDFRAISLEGRAHKMLAKVLASRLRKVVGKVVGHWSQPTCFHSWTSNFGCRFDC